MANSSAVYVCMDSTLKETAEEILSQLSITSSSAVQIFYRQIILHRGLPFDLTMPGGRPVAVGVMMSRAELDAELSKGIDALNNGPLYSMDEVDAKLALEFGI